MATPSRSRTRSTTGHTRRRATDAEAQALASALRLRILRACLGEAHTNKEIAQALDKDPATILHHVRRLVDTGFLEAQPVRRGTRGAREIPYLATGKSWRLETPGSGHIMLEVFLEEVALVPAEQVSMSRAGLRLDDAAREEFDTRFTALVEEFMGRTGSADAAPYSVFFAMHRDPNRV